MPHRIFLVVILSVVVGTPGFSLQKSGPSKRARGARAAAGSPEIAAIVSQISAVNIESDIRKLVTFQTRQTLSDATSETTGIGAARRWIKSEFDRYSQESGGRLQVVFDEFTQPPGRSRS